MKLTETMNWCLLCFLHYQISKQYPLQNGAHSLTGVLSTHKSSSSFTLKRVLVALCHSFVPFGPTHLTLAQHILRNSSSSPQNPYLFGQPNICFHGHYWKEKKDLGWPCSPMLMQVVRYWSVTTVSFSLSSTSSSPVPIRNDSKYVCRLCQTCIQDKLETAVANKQ